MKRLLTTSILAVVLAGRAAAADSAGVVVSKTYAAAHKYSLMGTLAPTVVGIGVSAATGGEAGDIGVSLSLGGLVIGPGLGHLYAGNPGRFAIGGGIRAVALVGGGLMAAQSSENKAWDESLGQVVLWIGLGTIVAVGSAIYDIRTTDASVNRYIRANRPSTRLTVSPTWFADRHAAGVCLALRL